MKENKSLNSLWYNFTEYLTTYKETGEYPFYLVAEKLYKEYKEQGGKKTSPLMVELMRRDEIETMLSDVILEEAGA